MNLLHTNNIQILNLYFHKINQSKNILFRCPVETQPFPALVQGDWAVGPPDVQDDAAVVSSNHGGRPRNKSTQYFLIFSISDLDDGLVVLFLLSK